jgi:hypothetical protein
MFEFEDVKIDSPWVVSSNGNSALGTRGVILITRTVKKV